MSLMSWGARVALARWFKRAREGKEGTMAKQTANWLMEHKAMLGLVVGAIWTVLQFVAADPACAADSPADYCAKLATASGILDRVAIFLVAAGVIPSDWNHRQGQARK